MTWAIAGRSKAKLDGLVQELREAQLPPPDGVIIADVVNVRRRRAASRLGNNTF